MRRDRQGQEGALVSILAILSLSCRGISPLRELDEVIQKISNDLPFGTSRLYQDTTTFALKSSTLIDTSISDRLKDDALRQSIVSLVCDCSKDGSRWILKGDLFVSWAYQAIIMARENYGARRGSRELANLSGITQWFTPGFVANYLLRESVWKNGAARSRPATFLDPACGAGHLLVPAIDQLMAGSKVDSALQLTPPVESAAAASMERLLDHQIYGLDIDKQMIRLSAFAIYLAARRYTRSELPCPHLYVFSRGDGRGSRDDKANDIMSSEYGSLLLGLPERDRYIHLEDLDGRRIPIDCLPKTFSSISTNPPYLSHRLMPRRLSDFLRKNYRDAHYDLYTAFLELTMRLLEPSGRASLICQQSFLTISRYENLRRSLVARCQIESVLQLGPGAFASRGGEKVNNALVSFRKLAPDGAFEKSARVSGLLDRDDLEQAQQDGLANIRWTTISTEHLRSITRIPGFSLALWCPREIADLFGDCPALGDPDTGIHLTNGLFTCNNELFVRHFTELPVSQMELYVPYDKGGGQKWFATTPYYLRWEEEGDAIRRYRKSRGQSAALPGERFYFKPGLTYSYIGTRGFKARYLSPGSIFDIASSAVFSTRLDLDYLLGFLNSSLTRYLLGILNPTVNFQIGDLRRLPFIPPDQDCLQNVAELARQAVELARQAERFDPHSRQYRKEGAGRGTCPDSEALSLKQSSATRKHLKEINRVEKELQIEIDTLIFELYEIPDKIRDTINKDAWVIRGAKDLISRKILKLYP